MGTANAGARIRKLELLSSAPTQEMRRFYEETIGLQVVACSKEVLTIQAGDCVIHFQEFPSAQDKPFYHFAFNIPENKIRSALKWQKGRTDLLPIPEHLRDPEYPPEVVDYSHWNAHSIFFLDPAGNVVEYIARHDLRNGASGDFSSADILYPSEIGIIVDDVPGTATALKSAAGLEQYRGGSDEFTALGDEHGLLLVMKRGRILNFNPATQEKAARIYKTGVHVAGSKSNVYTPADFPYRIVVDD